MTAGVLERDSDVGVALTDMHATVDLLLAVDFAAATDHDVLSGLAEAERLRRRLAALDHQLITQVDRRGLAQARGHRGPAGLLVATLRLSRADATARVRAAAACGPRMSLLGEPLPPDHPEVAAAQAAGDISAEHARVVTTTVDQLPGHLDADAVDAIGDALLSLARLREPEVVGKAARHALIVAELDGAPPEQDERREARRGLTWFDRPDGSARVAGELNPECAELLRTVLDPLARPKPAEGGVRDQRSTAQRRHDGLLDALKLVVRSDQLPDCGGVTTTVVITLSEDAWRTGVGTAGTGHGGVLTAREAIRQAGGDMAVVAAALDDMGAVTWLSGPHRLFTSRQRRVLAARDRGCTFPSCTAPPSWCESHHATDYAVTGWTSVDDGGLVCGYDHRERIRQGWTTTMIDKRMWWVPPAWIDPDRTPVRNTVHDTHQCSSRGH